MKALEEDIERHMTDVDEVKSNADMISQSTGDGRTGTYATQMVTRFQTLLNSAQVIPSLKPHWHTFQTSVDGFHLYI